MTHVITLMAGNHREKLERDDFAAVHDAAHAQGFHQEAPHWLAKDVACDIFLSGDGNADGAWVRHLTDALNGIDVVFQPVADRKKKLLISDMDSTIIQQECIDELAAEMGIKPQIAEITERAMNGELDFEAALTERVALLRGLEAEALERVYNNRIDFMPGAKELVATMRENGARCLLVSGGFTYFTHRVREALGFHGDRANLLEVEDGKLTGKVVHPILGKEAKVEALKEACYQLDIAHEDTLAIGDGANDLPMLQTAGLGIAYHAKPSVREAAKACVTYTDLRGALYVQGYTAEEIVG